MCHIVPGGNIFAFNLTKYIDIKNKKEGYADQMEHKLEMESKDNICIIEQPKSRNPNKEQSNYLSDDQDSESSRVVMDTISLDLNELQGMVDKLSQQEAQQYIEQFVKISITGQNLNKSIIEINEKCVKQKTESSLRITEIDKSIQLLLNEKTKITKKMNAAHQTMIQCKSKSTLCTNIVKNQLKLAKSREFAEKLENFEKQWSKWNSEQILVWFKAMVTISGNNSTNKSKHSDNKSASIDDEDEKSELQLKHDIDGQVAVTPGGGNVIEDSDKYIRIVSSNDNVDWSSISLNLKTRDWDGDHLLICKEKQLIKLGFDNTNVRKHLLYNIKRITKKYPPKTSSPKKGGNENSVCCICLSTKINTICIPCGHACMCKKCSNDYDKGDGCPICRKTIQNVFDMFIS